MPGYPTSCLSNAYMLLVPALRRMAHLPPHHAHTVTAPLAQRIVSTTGRHQFYTVRLVDGVAQPAFKASGDITSMSQADGYIEIPAQTDIVEKGEMVEVKSVRAGGAGPTCLTCPTRPKGAGSRARTRTSRVPENSWRTTSPPRMTPTSALRRQCRATVVSAPALHQRAQAGGKTRRACEKPEVGPATGRRTGAAVPAIPRASERQTD